MLNNSFNSKVHILRSPKHLQKLTALTLRTKTASIEAVPSSTLKKAVTSTTKKQKLEHKQNEKANLVHVANSFCLKNKSFQFAFFDFCAFLQQMLKSSLLIAVIVNVRDLLRR